MSEEKPYDAGDARDVREEQKTARYKLAKERVFLRTVMASQEGREWIYKTLSRASIYSSSFSTNALTMSFKEGERNMGLQIMMDVVQAAPEKYLEMLAEHGDKNV